MLTLVIQSDGLHPLCSVIGQNQELKIVNDMVDDLHRRARVAHVGFAHETRVTVPVGSSVLFLGPAHNYLVQGEHKLFYSDQGSPADIWLKSST